MPVKVGTTALFAVTLSQEGAPVFQAQIWTTGRCDPSLPLAPVMPDVPPPAGLRGLDALMFERGATPIDFWVNLEGRPVNSAWPVTRSPTTHINTAGCAFSTGCRPTIRS